MTVFMSFHIVILYATAVKSARDFPHMLNGGYWTGRNSGNIILMLDIHLYLLYNFKMWREIPEPMPRLRYESLISLNNNVYHSYKGGL